MNTSKQQLVSIIVRTKNEERWIGLCLDSINRQNYKNFEIILVDNNSTDRTIVKAKKYNVNVVSISDFLPGKAINDGIRASKGEIIVIISGHCIPINEFWLENLISKLENREIAGVYGRQEPLSFTTPSDKRDLAITFGLDSKLQIKDSFFHNANSALLRSTWVKFPFDENVTNIEDRVWGVEIIKAGFKIYYEPSASVYHYHGIHQDRNPERANNIIRIMESLHGPNKDVFAIAKDKIRIIAIIPIRGKYLSLENVNLLENTIKYLQKSKTISDIIISTDCKETADFAISLGASVPYIRPKNLSEKYVDLAQVLTFSIDEIEKRIGVVDLVVVLEETHQFRDEGMIDEMIAKTINQGLDSIIASKVESRPLWIEKNESLDYLRKLDFTPRNLSQEVAHIGLLGLGCVTRPAFLRNGMILGNKIGLHKVEHPLASVEIRNIVDLQKCLTFFKIK